METQEMIGYLRQHKHRVNDDTDMRVFGDIADRMEKQYQALLDILAVQDEMYGAGDDWKAIRQIIGAVIDGGEDDEADPYAEAIADFMDFCGIGGDEIEEEVLRRVPLDDLQIKIKSIGFLSDLHERSMEAQEAYEEWAEEYGDLPVGTKIELNQDVIIGMPFRTGNYEVPAGTKGKIITVEDGDYEVEFNDGIAGWVESDAFDVVESEE